MTYADVIAGEAFESYEGIRISKSSQGRLCGFFDSPAILLAHCVSLNEFVCK